MYAGEKGGTPAMVVVGDTGLTPKPVEMSRSSV
jgi:hypothetical protein